MKLDKWMAMSEEERRRPYRDAAPKCSVCHEPILEQTEGHPEEMKTLNDEVVHEDCYWGVKGEEAQEVVRQAAQETPQYQN